MATLNRTFSVKNGIDVANTIIIDSSRNLSNIATANATTVNATTFITTGGLNVTDQANAARDQANTARTQANTAYGQANTAYGQANDAYAAANTRVLKAGDTMTGNLNVAATIITQNIIPNLNETYDIGTPTKRYKDLYLSGSTIYIGETLLSTAGDEMRANTFNAAVSVLVSGVNVLNVANSAYGQANTAYGQANAARSDANTTFSTINTTFATLNTSAGSQNTSITNAHNAANNSGNTVRVSANSGSTLSNKQLNFANSSSIQITLTDAGDGNANIVFNTTGAAVADAYAQANTARDTANDAYAQANTARTTANGAYSQANGAYAQANGAYAQANAAANTVRVFANGGSILSSANLNFNNTATINVAATANGVGQANISFTVNNASFSSLGISTVPLTLGSNVTVSQDLIVTGNLRVEGDTTTFNVSNLAIEDSEIILNSNQTNSPSLNASIFAERGASTDTFLRWNEVTDKWGYSDDGTTFYSLDDIRSGLVTHNTTFGTTNTTFGTVNTTFGTINTNITTANTQANAARDQANSARDQANTGYDQANAAYLQANTARGQANDAYAAANTRVLKAGDTMTGALTITVAGTGLTVANANVTGNLTVGTLNVTSNTITTSTTGQAVLDSFGTSALASAKYFVQVKSGTDYHTTEVIVVQDATNVWLTEYGSIQTGGNLGTFSADINSGSCRLLFTPTNASNTIRSIRYGVIP